MANIKLLDSNTINKISAGEVVERPASCVKELVENAIDAGAKRIEVEILNGGKNLIRVTDDGAGMSKEDSLLAVKRHATSKLSNVRDLQNISTLGFRGEALPTISAVSNFTLQTRRAEDELGTQVKIDGGKFIDAHEIGCKTGTTVLVENLFFNTPARLKFLKSTATEANKIHEFIVKLSFSRPEISFKFISNGRTALTTPGTGKLFDTLTAVYGSEISGDLIEINLEIPDVNISGYIGKPNFLKSYRSWQTFIVNGRIISNRTISKAVEEGYKNLIHKGGYPFAVLKISVPQNSIDVNVHPQKTEIKFEDDGKIFKSVYRAVNEGVSEKKADLAEVAVAPENIYYEPLDLKEYFGETEQPAEKKNDLIIDPNSDKKSLSVEEIRELMEKSKTIDEDLEKSESLKVEKVENKISSEKKSSPNLEKLFPIGQVDLCYIIAKNNSSLYIIDQHAAHERILFDKLSGYADEIPAQRLLIHKILKFDPRESSLIENNLELFAKLGFTMEMSGENEFRLIEIPADASDSESENMFREIISSVVENEVSENIAANIRKSVLAVTACRAAVKAGQELNQKQMQIILDDLSKTPHPYTCPHGRPTIIKFSTNDLAKMFKRTGF
ncbi:MAG: DNA mismatch repair endonuclease MutL [Selenomonadaceae bacterium]|nr:DNA mismatch repair endonuclease MutL [Selenomonadaceae bacterium]